MVNQRENFGLLYTSLENPLTPGTFFKKIEK